MFADLCELAFKCVVLPVLVLVLLVLFALALPTMVEQATSDNAGWDSGERPEGVY